MGYGIDPELRIDLAYNVNGPFLPPNQRELEEFYAYQLKAQQGVVFNGLYAFNNFALGRFAARLACAGKLDYYLKMLADNYNAAVVAHGGTIRARDNHPTGTVFTVELPLHP